MFKGCYSSDSPQTSLRRDFCEAGVLQNYSPPQHPPSTLYWQQQCNPQESCSHGPQQGFTTRGSPSASPSSANEPGFHLRVVCVDGLAPGSPTLDGLHGCGVKCLLPHGPLLIRRAVGSLGLLLPLLLVYVVNPEQEAVVHDFEAFQHLQVRTEFKNKANRPAAQHSTDPKARNSPSSHPASTPSPEPGCF